MSPMGERQRGALADSQPQKGFGQRAMQVLAEMRAVSVRVKTDNSKHRVAIGTSSQPLSRNRFIVVNVLQTAGDWQEH
jgi:hypothetical protein